MFFRRPRPKHFSFNELLQKLRDAGFNVGDVKNSRVQVSRHGCATVIEDVPDAAPRIVERAGLLAGSEIASLVDGGFQKFFQTLSGKSLPALAEELEAVHTFEEDLYDALGIKTLYNEALGTVSTFSQYDRVKDRDRGVPKRAWE
jgi:hypothetical protein